MISASTLLSRGQDKCSDDQDPSDEESKAFWVRAQQNSQYLINAYIRVKD